MTGSVVSSNGELLPYSEITDSTYANLAAQNFALDDSSLASLFCAATALDAAHLSKCPQ